MTKVYKFDPDSTDNRANAKGLIGWKGSYPTTPCRFCGHEYFYWIGDWHLGYQCQICNKVWREDD